MALMRKIPSKFVLGVLGSLFIVSCQINQDDQTNEESIREPTPTLFGTAIKTPSSSEVPSTPLPKKFQMYVCFQCSMKK